MNIRTRINKLEQHQAMMDSVEDFPESLSPFEAYKRLINAPMRNPPLTKPRQSFTPEEAYAAMIGRTL